MPSLVQLQYALAVEHYRHFGKAARSCYVTQPTLSQQLHKLEEEVGIVLFDRLKKPVLATPAGQRFLEQARVVVREQEKLLHLAEQARSGELTGEFRLGVIPTVASDLLPLFLQDFAAMHPRVRLSVEELTTEVIMQRVELVVWRWRITEVVTRWMALCSRRPWRVRKSQCGPCTTNRFAFISPPITPCYRSAPWAKAIWTHARFGCSKTGIALRNRSWISAVWQALGRGRLGTSPFAVAACQRCAAWSSVAAAIHLYRPCSRCRCRIASGATTFVGWTPPCPCVR